jgi:hypothetical protein
MGLIYVVQQREFTCAKEEQKNELQSYKIVQIDLKKKQVIKSQKEESLIWGINHLKREQATTQALRVIYAVRVILLQYLFVCFHGVSSELVFRFKNVSIQVV